MFQISKKNRKFEKTCLDENSNLNVMRNRTSAERNSAPPTFGMESIDFRKFGGRNLGARLLATTSEAPTSLENYSPQQWNHRTFHLCCCGFRIPCGSKKRPHQTRQNPQKQQQHLEMRNRHAQINGGEGGESGVGGEGNTKKQYKRIAEHDPFPFSPDPPSPPICAQERGNDKTDIFKKLGRCLRKTIAKPTQNQNATTEPTKAVQKDEIQSKNCLR